MNKKVFKIPFINIICSFIFILAFFAGTTMTLPKERSMLFDLSANAAMDISNAKKEADKHFKTLASVLPMIQRKDAPKDIEPSGSVNNYTTDAPVLTSESSEKIQIKNDSGYEIDTEALLAEDVSVKSGEIQVLILHTHTSEAYTKSADADYAESDPYRTQDDSKNITAVGQALAETLKACGIGVIHDKTYHDYPAYSGAYRRALETIAKQSEEHPGITLVLDVHRDALQNENGEYMKTLTEINGEECAQALIVIGTDSGGLEHKSWRENLKWGLKLQKVMKEKYPSLPRPLHLCEERYNGHTSEGAMIIEIGSNGNTLPEALRTAKYVGECIAKLLGDLKK